MAGEEGGGGCDGGGGREGERYSGANLGGKGTTRGRIRGRVEEKEKDDAEYENHEANEEKKRLSVPRRRGGK